MNKQQELRNISDFLDEVMKIKRVTKTTLHVNNNSKSIDIYAMQDVNIAHLISKYDITTNINLIIIFPAISQ